MRILAIRGGNLASLARTFEVDLEHGPLAGVGLFAITGPVGAGKSTLLDAMCLALFDQTPRLRGRGGATVGDVGDDPEAWLRANDPRTLLRRDAAEGFAEVDFVGRDGVRYRAHWAVRRARRRPDGRVQEQELSLRDLDRGVVVASGRRTEVLAAIQVRLGLDFQQFCRSVLLAQGDFAAFLQAPADERAKLLETLTGAGIYRRLSRAAHERRRHEEHTVAVLRAQLQGQAPMAAAVRSELERAQQRWKEQVAVCEVAEKLASEYVAWHATAEKWRAAEAAATHELQTALDASAAAEPQRVVLARLQRAVAVVPRLELRAEAEAKVEQARATVTVAARAVAAAAELHAKAETAWQRAFAAGFGAQATPVAAPLLRDDTQWAPLLQQWRLNTQRAAAIAVALPERKLALDGAAAAVAAQRGAVAQARAERDAAAAQWEQAQAALAAIDTAALAMQRNALIVQRAQAVASGDAAKAWTTASTAAHDVAAQAQQLAVQQAAMQAAVAASAAQQSAALATRDQLQHDVERARTHAGLAALRSQLVDGAPCPLCGSSHHEVTALESADLSVLQSALAQAERGAATMTQRAAAAVVELAAHERDRHRVAAELVVAKQRAAAAAAAFVAIAGPCMDSAAAMSIAVRERDGVAAAEQALRASDDAVTAAMSGSQRATARLAAVEQAFVTANLEVERLGVQFDMASERLQALQREGEQCAQRVAEVAAALAPACADLPMQDGALGVLLANEAALLRQLQRAVQAKEAAAAAVAGASDQCKLVEAELQRGEAAARAGTSAFEQALQQAEVTTEDVASAASTTADSLRDRAAALQALQSNIERCRAIVGERTQQRRQHEDHARPSLDATEAGKALLDARDHRAAAQKELEAVRVQLHSDDLIHRQRAELQPRLDAAERTLHTWVMLDDLIGSSGGDAFAVFAQGLTLDLLLGEANRRLAALVGRYRLQRNRTGELDFVVVDLDLGGSVRALQTLSGGETFLVSLALALALATLAAPRSRVETLFLDEGFGTLDAQSLEQALGALDSLQAAGCQVGIISHVDGIAERIGAQVVVQPEGAGQSRVLARGR